METNIVLICEDNELIVKLTSYALAAEGYKIDVAKSTEEANTKIRNTPPDLILLDLNLPTEGGAKVLDQLKGQKETENIPVVLFSGEENLSETAKKLRADGFLHKPFEVSDLINTVGNLTKKEV